MEIGRLKLEENELRIDIDESGKLVNLWVAWPGVGGPDEHEELVILDYDETVELIILLVRATNKIFVSERMGTP